MSHFNFQLLLEKNNQREKHDDVGYVNDLCQDSGNPIVLQLFSAFGPFLSLSLLS